MVIVWQPKSEERLNDIHAYYKVRSKSAADKLLSDIERAVSALAEFPQMGALESLLSDLQISFRSLVVRDNYKIVYFIDEDNKTVNIATVWDCRQDNKRLKEEVV